MLERELSAAEKTDGNGKTLTWDGAAGGSAGPLSGKFIGPAWSPYHAVLEAASGEHSARDFQVQVHDVAIALTGDDGGKLFMNTPTTRFSVAATVRVKKIDNTGVVTPSAIQVLFSFRDPAPANTTHTESWHYPPSNTALGKRTDPAAPLWDPDPAAPATSDDAFTLTAKVDAITAAGADRGKAKVLFKSSGVGGDDFVLKAAVKSSAGAELSSHEGPTLTVWRSVAFANIYEMAGQTHVSTNGTTATISPVFDPTFVRYTAGGRTEIGATFSVKYIGLWGGSATPQRVWATERTKLAAETPTATELTNADYSGADAALLATRATARAAINAKAQAWADRIDGLFRPAMRQWVTDAAIPANALVAIQHYHPKYSPDGGDAVTTEWNLYTHGTPAWLRVTVFSGNYTVDPDANWTSWGGREPRQRAGQCAHGQSHRDGAAGGAPRGGPRHQRLIPARRIWPFARSFAVDRGDHVLHHRGRHNVHRSGEEDPARHHPVRP